MSKSHFGSSPALITELIVGSVACLLLRPMTSSPTVSSASESAPDKCQCKCIADFQADYAVQGSTIGLQKA